LGESLLLGRETLHREPVDGLHTDAMTLVAEVIESKIKPSKAWGSMAQNAFGESPVACDRGEVAQTLLAIGRQDVDPEGMLGPPGLKVVDASSDHLIVECSQPIAIGSEIPFQLNYGALTRAMTSPFVHKKLR